jgi:hypothetical protein
MKNKTKAVKSTCLVSLHLSGLHKSRHLHLLVAAQPHRLCSLEYQLIFLDTKQGATSQRKALDQHQFCELILAHGWVD